MSTDGTDQIRSSTSHPDDALAAYALGVLDIDERAAVEAHLAGCESCQAELARQEEVVGSLGFAAEPVPPSTALRDTLLAETQPRQISPRIIVLAAAAAIALVSIVVLSILLAQTIEERDDARRGEQRMAAYLADGGTLSPLLPAPESPSGVDAGNGSLAIAPSDDRAMLVVYDLQPSSDGWRYTAWAEHGADRLRLGEIEVDDQGVGWLVFYPPEAMSTYDTVGINRSAPDADDAEPFLVATVNP